MEEKILQLHSDMIETKLDSVTRSDTYSILKKFLNVLDNSGQLMARLPQGIYQPCYKFVGHSDEPRLISDAYALGTSELGVNQINTLLKDSPVSPKLRAEL